MFSFRTCFLVISCLFSIPVALTEPAAPPGPNQGEPGRTVGTDVNGDPLPAGASARLGTLRLRHQGEVYSVAFSGDGQTLASAGDGTVRLWEAATGKELRRIQGVDTFYLTVALSPDGKKLAAAGGNEEVILWDTVSGEELDRFGRPGHDDRYIVSLAFSPDGKILALGGPGGLRLWDVVTGTRLPAPESNLSGIRSVAFSPDGKVLAFVDGQGLYLWALAGEKELLKAPAPQGEVVRSGTGDGKVGTIVRGGQFRTVGFAAGGKQLTAVDDGGLLWFWDAATGQELRRQPDVPHLNYSVFSADGSTLAVCDETYDRLCLCATATGKQRCLSDGSHQSGIHGVAFAPDGKTLATAGADYRVRLWDVATGKERVDLGGSERGSPSLEVASDGKQIVSLAGDGIFRIWETATGRLVRTFTTKNNGSLMARSPDGTTLASTSKDNRVLLWDAATGELRRRLGRYPKGIWFVTFAPDGKTLATGSESFVSLVEVATGQELRRLEGHEGEVCTGAFAPDGKTLVTGGDDAALRVWDVASGKELQRLDGHGGFGILDMSFAPNGKLLASVASDDFIALWEVGGYRRLRHLAKPHGGTSFVTFSTDGQLLAADSGGNTLSVWETGTGKVRCRLAGHEGPVTTAAFLPGGKLVSGSEDGTALVWDLERVPPEGPRPEGSTDLLGDPLPAGAVARLGSDRLRHKNNLAALAFAPDGRTMALGTEGNEPSVIRLVEVATGKEVWRIQDYQDTIEKLAFSPDGKLLAGSTGKGIYLWDPATGARLQQILGHPSGVSTFAFSPDSRMLAVAGCKASSRIEGSGRESKDSSIHLWDTNSGREMGRLFGDRTGVSAVVFSSDGRWLWSASAEEDWDILHRMRRITGSLCLWDITTRKLLYESPVPGVKIIFSPDGQTLAYPEDETVCFRDLTTERTLWRLPAAWERWTFTADGKAVIADGGDGFFQLRESATGKELRRWRASLENRVRLAGVSPDGKLLATAQDNREDNCGTVRLWDTGMGEEWRPFGGHREPIICLAYSGDGKTVASGAVDRTVRVWEVTTGKEHLCYSGHQAALTAIALSSDGRQAVSADDSNTVLLWEVATGKELGRLAGLTGPVTSLAFHADGRRVVLGRPASTVGLWEVTTGKKEFRTFGDQEQGSRETFVSPDGRLVAGLAGSCKLIRPSTNRLHVWSWATGRLLYTIEGEGSEVFWSAAFSPDSKTLAAQASFLDDFHSNYNGHHVRLWEATSGKQLWELDTGVRSQALAFSPDARLLAVPGHGPFDLPDRSVQLWDLATGSKGSRFRGHLGKVEVLTFSPDGRTLASGSSDDTILIWDVTAPALRRCPWWARRPLTNPETLWATLAEGDAVRAHHALWQLVASPRQTIPFLRERLRPVAAADTQRVGRLITDLDNDQFAVRQQATEELAEFAEVVEPALRQALAGPPTPEARRRIEGLLEKLDEGTGSPDRLRLLRACGVLERISTPEARCLLAELAAGAAAARLTQEARASLERLDRQHAGQP